MFLRKAIGNAEDLGEEVHGEPSESFGDRPPGGAVVEVEGKDTED